MPSRNIVRLDAPQSYYHVYARGLNKQPLFLNDKDFIYFEGLLERYLSPQKVLDKMGIEYPNFSKNIELLSYCLMNNHFHLLIYQDEIGHLSGLMKSLMSSYSLYFNLKYKRTGTVYESRYKSSKIENQSYLEHISRYIHLNPRYWRRYPYSSYHKLFSYEKYLWLKPNRIMELFTGMDEFTKFLEDYEDYKEMLDEIKHDLANH